MLSWIVTRLRDSLSRTGTSPSKRDFSDAAFFNYVSQRDKPPESLKQAASDFSLGKTSDARRRVLLYFRSRAAPRFFIDLDEIPKLAEEIRQRHLTWYSAQTKKIETTCDVGLAIYSAIAEPLRPGFPWYRPAPGHDNDLLYSVRPHRFAFAPRMALVGLSSRSVVDRLAAIVNDWLTSTQRSESSFPYISNLVVIQRLLALCWTWAFLAARSVKDDSHGMALEWALIKIIRVDVAYLIPRLGTSYPNNHLLIDRFAGWYIAQWLPEFCGVNALSENETKWLQELQRQTLSDGTGFEHSVHYHEFGCEMAVAYYVLSSRNQRQIATWFKQRLAQMLSFQADMGGPHGLAPAIGNTTEDPLFPLDASEGWASAAWWVIDRELFDAGRPPLVSADKPSVERAIWLLGKNLPQELGPEPPKQSYFHAYPEGGFFVFNERDQSIRLTFRTGPAPKTNISAGHMHADLLSLYLTVEDELVLVDAGTYTYRNTAHMVAQTSVNWRQYFAGPSAHNGPTLESLDPHSILSSDFRPLEQTARVKINRSLDRRAACWVEACIENLNAYNGITRGVVFIPDQYFVVYDSLIGSGSRLDVTYGFQLAAESEVSTYCGSVFGNTNGRPWEINAGPGLKLATLLEGSTNPLGGWVSTTYGDLISAPQVRFRNDHSRVKTAFIIRAGKQIHPGEILLINANDSRNGSLALQISMGRTTDYLIIQPTGKADTKDCWGIDFDGDLLWIRTHNSRAQTLRWLDGRFARCQDIGLRVEARLPISSLELVAPQSFDLMPSSLSHCELG